MFVKFIRHIMLLLKPGLDAGGTVHYSKRMENDKLHLKSSMSPKMQELRSRLEPAQKTNQPQLNFSKSKA
jgi:hypothetical protein